MPKAILSVHDKTGLVEFARGLLALNWTLIASGGTAKLLRESGIPVTEVAEYTGSPEILGGRVKTLHPAIHGGLLARANQTDLGELKKLGWDYLDLVACNLYPFQQTVAKPGVTLDEAIENIDIGGVTLIRAAAKNHQRVILCCDPADYPAVLDALRAGTVDEAARRKLAGKGFGMTAEYDAAIHAYLAGGDAPLRILAHPQQKLRYGENPHQTAAIYAYAPGAGPLGGKVLQGKELSYTNLLDMDAAWRTAVGFERPTVAIVKHVSPCGVACASELPDAFRGALASDPVSAYGGVVAANRPVDEATVKAMGNLFIECIIAPGFSAGAREELARRKNCRLLEMPDTVIEPAFEFRSVTRGVLMQDSDFGDPALTPEWKVVSRRTPSAEEMKDLRFAWKACQFVRSNAIVFAHSEATVGIGGGQPNRVDCVRIAAQRAGEKAQGAVMASDAFFPFPDSVQVAAEAGITAVIHPGGSVRDAEAIAAADAAGMAMVVTGVRHFKH
ncbi:MAG: bifunctional phosphoribosylaminoimidazolecarboxamide formyltransferase/IMP cyclohydrolase [Anaerolineales bacterium]|nr:bifunctional phosphoribosylaminoimidazolecarboxamide formyltransferase/IMP cyclohydrolase [Anaerolineales bacterium]